MSMYPDPPPPPPGQTIVLERRERPGCLSRLFWPVLLVSIALNVAYLSRQTGDLVPERLEEHYVAGSVAPTEDKVAIVRIEGVIALDEVDFGGEQPAAA